MDVALKGAEMQAGPGLVVRAKAGTKTEGKLSLAEAAGIKAIFSEIKQAQHRRRELTMQDQKEAETEERLVDALNEAWAELCIPHGFDPNVPISSWTVSKKNRALLDPANHPVKTPKLMPGGKKEPRDADGATNLEQGADPSPGDGGPERGDDGAAGAGGGDADG